MRSANNEEQRFVLEKVCEWIRIKRKFEKRGNELRTDKDILDTLEMDMWHSALLQRLLSGKEALPVPPPREYSYPAYHLFDEDEPQPVREVHFGQKDSLVNENQVAIEQAIWDIESKEGEDNYIVRWFQTDPAHRFKLYKKDNVKIGTGRISGSEEWGPIYGESWVMERIDDGKEAKA